MSSDGESKLTCTFCGKSKDDVKALIVGARASICDECIDLATEALSQNERNTNVPGQFTSVGNMDKELLGTWRRKQSATDVPNVSLRFTIDGLMISTVVEHNQPKNLLSRYRVQGTRLVTAELVTIRAEKSGEFRIGGDTLTLDGKTEFVRESGNSEGEV